MRSRKSDRYFAEDIFKRISCSWVTISNFKQIFNEIYSLWFSWQYGRMGLDNGLAPIIIWNNVGLLYWRIFASLGLTELNGLFATNSYSTLLKAPWNIIGRLVLMLVKLLSYSNLDFLSGAYSHSIVVGNYLAIAQLFMLLYTTFVFHSSRSSPHHIEN